MAEFTSTTSFKKPGILIVGPNLAQVGGVSTFINILLSSARLQEEFQLLHLDTTRGSSGAGLAGQLRLVNLYYFITQVYQFFRLVIKFHPQVVHLPVTSYWAFWKATGFIILAKIMSLKIIAHLHGGMFDQYYGSRSKLVRRLIGLVLHQADIIIALSQWWKDFLLREVKSDLNIEVIPNTIDWSFAKAINADKPKQQNGTTILFVGGLGHRKGVFDILDAVPLITHDYPKVKILFAGIEEENGAQAQIDRICLERNLFDNVQFLGEVSGQEKISLFKSASIFLLPSHGENLPYALLEAMGAGLAVITTPVGAIPEIVKDRVNGILIRAGDIKALARSVIELLNQPQQREQMGAVNINLIRKQYMPEAAIKQFESIYTRLI